MEVMQARKAMEYERKIEKDREESIVKERLNERKAGKENKENLKDRLDYFKKCGFSQEGVDLLWRKGKPIGEVLRNREIEVKKQMHWTRIKETRYNRRYKYLTPGTLPKYLRERRRNGEQRILARARCSTTENAKKFWARKQRENVRYVKRRKKRLNTGDNAEN